MPLPLIISYSNKSRLVLPFLVLPFWYLLTRVVPDRFQQSSKTVVCVVNVIVLVSYYYYYFTSVFIAAWSYQLFASSSERWSLCKPPSGSIVSGHSFTVMWHCLDQQTLAPVRVNPSMWLLIAFLVLTVHVKTRMSYSVFNSVWNVTKLPLHSVDFLTLLRVG